MSWNLSYPQIALVAVLLAGVLGAHYLGAGALETALVSGFGVVFAGLASLKNPPPPELFQSKAVQAEGSYTGELLACTAASKTLAESKACECQVKTKWGISCS